MKLDITAVSTFFVKEEQILPFAPLRVGFFPVSGRDRFGVVPVWVFIGVYRR
jgi:hypothetical protein